MKTLNLKSTNTIIVRAWGTATGEAITDGNCSCVIKSTDGETVVPQFSLAEDLPDNPGTYKTVLSPTAIQDLQQNVQYVICSTTIDENGQVGYEEDTVVARIESV